MCDKCAHYGKSAKKRAEEQEKQEAKKHKADPVLLQAPKTPKDVPAEGAGGDSMQDSDPIEIPSSPSPPKDGDVEIHDNKRRYSDPDYKYGGKGGRGQPPAEGSKSKKAKGPAQPKWPPQKYHTSRTYDRHWDQPYGDSSSSSWGKGKGKGQSQGSSSSSSQQQGYYDYSSKEWDDWKYYKYGRDHGRR